ncbi:MAG: alpha/beta fold hydrolase [Ktedonobacterales bacterium]|nr:alpha/beta fold hydrolase [Ktedonobacterales bacterium]
MGKRRLGLLALGGAAGAVGALALREGLQRRSDRFHFEAGREYWRLSYPPEYVEWVEEHLTTYHIPAGDVGIHLDVYPQSERTAPVVILVHGLMTYGRLFVQIAHALYERGYTVVCTDIVGNGYSGGVRGDCPVGPATASVVQCALWVRQRFDGPLYMLGISLGGAIVYAAAAAGAPVSAISCLDLFLFDDPVGLRRMVVQPRLIGLLPLLRLLAVPFGWVRVPTSLLNTLEHVVAPEEQGTAQAWMFDPLLTHQLTLRTLVSAASTHPAVQPERNTVPTLVMNQECDQVLDPAVTRAVYGRLGGPKKYVEFAGSPHWSFTHAFQDRIAAESDAWFQRYGAQTHAPSTAVVGHSV